jgi:MFS family permease
MDGRASWIRLGILVFAAAVGGVAMWSVVVTLPAVQQDFGTARAGASLPYTLTMLGYAIGGVGVGRLSDRFGMAWTTAAGAIALGLGYILASLSTSFVVYTVLHFLLCGTLGGAAFFSPLMAEASRWFLRHRGVAVTLAAAGNYIGGAIWPPLTQALVGTVGWRGAEMTIGILCIVLLLPLALLLRARPPLPGPAMVAHRATTSLDLAPRTLQLILAVAGIGCCVAMAMPQVHIVAYCGDLGYGPAQGADMLSMMLALGIVSRVGSGFVADRIGGIATLLIGSGIQAVCLSLYLQFTSLPSLYVIAALFGLFQGGIVPSYAIIAREYFPAREAGARVGAVIGATICGMAFGGWLSGAIYDLSGSYRLAFFNGLAFNLLNLALIGFLFLRSRGGARVRALA